MTAHQRLTHAQLQHVGVAANTRIESNVMTHVTHNVPGDRHASNVNDTHRKAEYGSELHTILIFKGSDAQAMTTGASHE
eukprot:6492744-Amphidinium_carterae.6